MLNQIREQNNEGWTQTEGSDCEVILVQSDIGGLRCARIAIWE